MGAKFVGSEFVGGEFARCRSHEVTSRVVRAWHPRVPVTSAPCKLGTCKPGTSLTRYLKTNSAHVQIQTRHQVKKVRFSQLYGRLHFYVKVQCRSVPLKAWSCYKVISNNYKYYWNILIVKITRKSKRRYIARDGNKITLKGVWVCKRSLVCARHVRSRTGLSRNWREVSPLIMAGAFRQITLC